MKRLALVFAVVLVALGTPAPAQACQLAFSVPAHQSTVTAAPERIALYFTERHVADGTFSIVSPSGKGVLGNWSRGEPAPLPSPLQEYRQEGAEWKPITLDTGFPAVLTATHWPETGVYTVNYDVRSSDGDNVKGTLRFDYQGPVTAGPAQTAAPADTRWVWWVIPAAIVVIGLSIALLHRRRAPRAT